jgi:hypothetical protein
MQFRAVMQYVRKRRCIGTFGLLYQFRFPRPGRFVTDAWEAVPVVPARAVQAALSQARGAALAARAAAVAQFAGAEPWPTGPPLLP